MSKHDWVIRWLAVASWIEDLVVLFRPRSRTAWYVETPDGWMGPCRTMEDAVKLGAITHPGNTFTLKTRQQPTKTWTVSYTKTYANPSSYT